LRAQIDPFERSAPVERTVRDEPVFARVAAVNLTPREAQVLGLVAYGHTTAEIAEALGLSKRTVEMHRAGGMRHLGIRSRREVVQWAIASGHLDTDASAAVDAAAAEAHKRTMPDTDDVRHQEGA
jgi:DNA-binding CsgD family transcriptional regulator